MISSATLLCVLRSKLGDIAVVIPRGARKAHFRSRNIGDPALPHHLGHEELDLVVNLQSTTIDWADLDVVLVVFPFPAISRVRKQLANKWFGRKPLAIH